MDFGRQRLAESRPQGLRLRGLVRTEQLRFETDHLPLQDILALALIAEARDLVSRGLHREYVRRRESLVTPRGRLDFLRIVRQGGLTEASVPCRFHRRSNDSPLNRALAAGLRHCAHVAADHELRAEVRRLAQELEFTITPIRLSREVLKAARSAMDRRTRRYAAALQLIELLYNGQAVTLEDAPGAKRVPLPGFALDMNRMWQRLFARVFSEWTAGVQIEEEFALREIFQRDSDYPLRRGVPRPRPDFAAFDKGRLLGFLDAKYRDLWELQLPREMLYQLALYAMAQGRGTAAILYPSDSATASEQRISIRDPLTDSKRAAIALRPVSLARLEALITAPVTDRLFDDRRVFSRQLLGAIA